METDNIASISWGDHLLFGDGDGKLETPGALERRLEQWQERLGVSTVFWREKRTTATFHFSAAPGYRTRHFKKTPAWDNFESVPRICHRSGVKAYLYVTLFDEGWPLPPKNVREVSYHNAMHGRHWSRQSVFTREHPDYLMCDRTGKIKQWREWVKTDLIDDLVINQNSCQCPSMWHLLWPMHRGYGYIQNYIDQKNMPELNLQIESVYQPILSRSSSSLYVSRQWDVRSSRAEAELLAHPVVKGLVFSTFRFDNPEAIRQGDWRA